MWFGFVLRIGSIGTADFDARGPPNDGFRPGFPVRSLCDAEPLLDFVRTLRMWLGLFQVSDTSVFADREG